MADQTHANRLSDDQIQAAIDCKTKPRGALGHIETLAAQIARLQGTTRPQMDFCRLTIFAADHGLATTGISAFPQDVTRQMVLNFLAGGAAANVFARTVDVTLQVVDAGCAGAPIDHQELQLTRIGPGTANALVEPAMTEAQRDTALAAGREIGAEGPYQAVCFGDMGIGNTASASLIGHKILGAPLDQLVGRGTGLDDAGLAHKQRVLGEAADRTAARLPALTALAEYGGFEIAMMAGAMMGAAEQGKLVLVDGFIAGAAALIARELSPDVMDSLVFAHESAEPGHRVMLQALDARPLLQLDMRLGEGTGALLAWPLVKAAAAMLSDMATFESAQISQGT